MRARRRHLTSSRHSGTRSIDKQVTRIELSHLKSDERPKYVHFEGMKIMILGAQATCKCIRLNLQHDECAHDAGSRTSLKLSLRFRDVLGERQHLFRPAPSHAALRQECCLGAEILVHRVEHSSIVKPPMWSRALRGRRES